MLRVKHSYAVHNNSKGWHSSVPLIQTAVVFEGKKEFVRLVGKCYPHSPLKTDGKPPNPSYYRRFSYRTNSNALNNIICPGIVPLLHLKIAEYKGVRKEF